VEEYKYWYNSHRKSYSNTNNQQTNKMNFQNIFENAIDMTEYTYVPYLPNLHRDELDSILFAQLEEFKYSEPKTENDEINGLIFELRQTRVRLGFTQTEMANSISELCGKKISQTTVCRFEGKILTKRNMVKLRPTFEHWIYLANQNPHAVRSACS